MVAGVGGVELATAYVSIVPSTKGLGASVAREFAGVERLAGQTGTRAGSHMASTLGRTLKVGAAVAGGAITTVLGTALVKGFSRLKALDQAKMKFGSLGYSAQQVSGIMDTVAKSVEGTAFALDEAATISTSLLAAGIKPGKALESTLRDIGGVAAITGRSLSEVGLVWGQVAAKGRLQGDEMLQLQEKGVPVLQMLSEHYGITAQAASKMVSQGKVDFTTFSEVMHEKYGKAAEDSGKTFTGALANVRTGLGRLAAQVMGPAFDQMPALLMKIVAWLKTFGPAATEMGKKVGAAFASAVAKFQSWLPFFARIKDGITGLYSLIAKGDFTSAFSKAFGIEEDSPVVAAILRFRDIAVSAFSTVRNFLANLSGGGKAAFGGLASSIALLVSHFGGFRVILGMIGPFLKTTFTNLGGVSGILTKMKGPLGLVTLGFAALAGGFLLSKDGGAGFTAMLNGLVGKVTEFATTQLPALVNSFAAALPGIVAKIMPAIITVFETIAKVLPSLINSLVSVLITLVPALIQAGITLFTALITALSKILPVLLDGTVKLITALVGLLPTLIPVLLNAAVTLLLAIVNAIDKILPPLIKAGIALIDAVVRLLPTLIPILLDAAIKLFLALVKAIPIILPRLITAATTLINALITYLPQMIPVLINAAITLFMALVKAVPMITAALLKAVWDLIVNQLGPKIAQAWEWVKARAVEAWNGIVAAIGNAWNAVLRTVSKPIEWVVNVAVAGLVEAVNKVLSWLGMNPIPVPHFAGWGYYTGAGSTAAAEHRARGGMILGYSPSPVSDNIPALLTAGEYVLPVPAVDRLRSTYGTGGLESLRRGELPHFAEGGLVGAWNAVTSFFANIWHGITSVGGGMLDLVKKIPPKIWEWIRDKIGGTVKAAIDAILSAITGGGSARPGSGFTDSDTAARLARAYAAYGGSVWNIQGSWSDNPLSAGTHLGAGVVDIMASDPYALVRALQAAGLVAYYRNWPGNQHIHVLNPYASGLSAAARSQLGMRSGGLVPLFDNGGWLRPGLNLVRNGTGSMEHVAPDGLGDIEVRVFIGERELTNIVRTEVHGGFASLTREVARVGGGSR